MKLELEKNCPQRWVFFRMLYALAIRRLGLTNGDKISLEKQDGNKIIVQKEEKS